MPKVPRTKPDCAIDGCGRVAMTPPRDHAAQITPPICTLHAITIWRHMQTLHGYEPVLAQVEQVNRVVEELKPPAPVGDIYVVRLNGLIKVGWSANLYQRLRSYGPSVEILCHYPGSRKDETELHQILTPLRAKGREWYEDHRHIADYVATMVAKHGPPSVRPEWTKPKEVIGGRR